MSSSGVGTLTAAPPPPITPPKPPDRGGQAPAGRGDGVALQERPAGPPRPGQVHNLMQTHAERDQLINGMLMSDGSGKPSQTEAASLRSSLGAVDTGVLRFASDSGLKIGVLNPGDEMFQAGVLRRQDPKAIQARGPELQAFAQKLDAQLDQKYGNRLDSVKKELAALPEAPMAGFGMSSPDPHAEKRGNLFQQLQTLEGQRGKELGDAVEKSGLPVKPFVIPTDSKQMLGSPAAQQMALVQAMMPMSTAGMAAIHGAKTPEQVKEFHGLLESINGPRLQAAREDALGGMRQAAERAKTPEEKAHFENLLKLSREKPEAIPLDYRKHNLLVPDMHYVADDKGKTTTVDLHDKMTLMDWSGSGTRTQKAFDEDNLDGSVIEGQYFSRGGMNKMVVRDTALGKGAPVHELGHAIDFQMEQKDPQFYQGWKARLEAAHARTEGLEGKTVSEYAKTNPREYAAEGFAHYYEDPKGLKAADPALFALTEELIARASALGGRR